ncbi:hypothetical protein DRO30_02600 [Candidatus Bathyarchaeota archaeon]|nr:MAG: hypothetical protein DRO30_02600 [Candidatus Bathyarchaeota archaeon]
MSEESIAVVIAGLVAVIAFFLLALASTLIGAFTGWLVGLTPLGTGVMKIWVGLTGIECDLWELGAFLGFISGFFRSILKFEDKD